MIQLDEFYMRKMTRERERKKRKCNDVGHKSQYKHDRVQRKERKR